MTRRFSVLAEPEDALWRVYRIWRECRRLEANGHSASSVASAFYENVTELFTDGDPHTDTRRARASAADTQPIEDVDELTTTTTPPPNAV